MKQSLKALLILAGAALATSVAQANPYPLTETTTAAALPPTAGYVGKSISVQTTVSQVGGDYKYTYVVSPNPLTGNIDAYSVEGGDFVGVTAITGTGGFSGVNNGDEIDWSHVGNVVGTETFSYISPLAPVQGIEFAQDTYHYASSAVYVPAPDGGVTATLLGGALLGLGAIRRKLGC